MTAINAKVVADSINQEDFRLITLVATYPRFIHSEVMTYAMWARNAASSRAIPIEKTIDQVLYDPALPVYWGSHQKGMQAGPELTGADLGMVTHKWLDARDNAVSYARRLNELGLHKQLTNRILEPWQWMVTVITATEWANMFNQRHPIASPDAQPEFKALAVAMLDAINASTPTPKRPGEWHLPFTTSEERNSIRLAKDICDISVARCARTSYKNHDNPDADPVKDLAMTREKLLPGKHMSPFGHVAQAPHRWENYAKSNLIGWAQYRKMIDGENQTEFAPMKQWSYHDLREQERAKSE